MKNKHTYGLLVKRKIILVSTAFIILTACAAFAISALHRDRLVIKDGVYMFNETWFSSATPMFAVEDGKLIDIYRLNHDDKEKLINRLLAKEKNVKLSAYTSETKQCEFGVVSMGVFEDSEFEENIAVALGVNCTESNKLFKPRDSKQRPLMNKTLILPECYANIKTSYSEVVRMDIEINNSQKLASIAVNHGTNSVHSLDAGEIHVSFSSLDPNHYFLRKINISGETIYIGEFSFRDTSQKIKDYEGLFSINSHEIQLLCTINVHPGEEIISAIDIDGDGNDELILLAYSSSDVSPDLYGATISVLKYNGKWQRILQTKPFCLERNITYGDTINVK